jgi:hypothetical protein
MPQFSMTRTMSVLALIASKSGIIFQNPVKFICIAR